MPACPNPPPHILRATHLKLGVHISVAARWCSEASSRSSTCDLRAQAQRSATRVRQMPLIQIFRTLHDMKWHEQKPWPSSSLSRRLCQHLVNAVLFLLVFELFSHMLYVSSMYIIVRVRSCTPAKQKPGFVKSRFDSYLPSRSKTLCRVAAHMSVPSISIFAAAIPVGAAALHGIP